MKSFRISPSSKKRILFSSLNVTTLFVLINVILFLLFYIWYYFNSAAMDFIALKPFNLLSGKYVWTLLTSMFMHGGIFHLFVNMFSLFFVGSFVEKILGKKRYFWLYILSGLFAGLFFVFLSFLSSSNLNTYAVGASGALFALIGFLMLLTPDQPVYLMFIPIPIKMKYAAPGMLIVLWLISIAGNIPIGNTAHLGGLIAGLAYGIYIKMKYPNKSKMIRRHFS